MPATYRIDVESRLVVITWPAATPDVHAWRGVIQKLVFDPAFPAGARILSDWRLANGAPDEGFVENFIQALGLLHSRGVVRWATVIPPTQVAYGVGRMAEMRAELHNLHFRAFNDYTEAEAWLLGDFE
jgi:hypothetical protein